MYSRVRVSGLPKGCPCQPSTTCGPETPSPRRNRPPESWSSEVAVDAVRAGVRAAICMIALPRRILLVCPPIQASGVTASEPYASAVHTEWKPRRSASRTRSMSTASCAPEALVDPRELRDDVVERRRLDAAGAEIDAPAVHASRVLVAVARVRRRPGVHEVELPVARHVEHDRVAVGEGVHGVEDVRRLGLEPAHVDVAAAPRHDTEPRAALRLPGEGAAALRHVLEAEDERAEDEDDVVPRDREIVDHRGPGDVDHLAAHEPSVAVGDVVLEPGREGRVAEEEHLARLGVHLRMRGHGPDQPPVEVELAERLEGARLHARREGGLHQREQSPGVPHDVRVAGVLEAWRLARVDVEEPREEPAAGGALLLQAGAQHVAVAVVRAPIGERDGVDHAVAVEPVVAPGRLEGRVRSVAVVGAVQLPGNPAADLEVPGYALHAPGSEVALQEDVHLRFATYHGRFPFWPRGRRARRAAAAVVSWAINPSRRSATAGSWAEK